MTLKTQEYLRVSALLIRMAIGTGIKFAGGENYLYYNELLILENLAILSYEIGFPTTLRQDPFATDYKELEKLYIEVIDNTLALIKELNINDPVSIFATYMYMYRHGYLSHNHQYNYDMNMKDLGKLCGLDVVRGHGVCRSVAELLKDIYLRNGYTSQTIGVNAKNAIPIFETLCDIEVPEEDDITKKISSLIIKIKEFLPLNDHMITIVSDGSKNFIFDPMNDGFLLKGVGKKLLVANNPNYYMEFNKGHFAFYKMLGQVSSSSFTSIKKQLQLPSIDYKEYKEIYIEILRLCQESQELFADLYNTNLPLYNEIYEIGEEIHNLFLRLTGIGVIEDLITGPVKKLKR